MTSGPIEFEPQRARRFRKRSEILAFKSNDALTYHKSWGTQNLPDGGWVAVALNADGQPTGEVYGIDDDAFHDTYAPSLTGQPHRYMKTATIEAYQPGHAFIARTELEDKEDPTLTKIEVERSEASDTAMLVRNPGGEVYPIELDEFERMYVEVITPKRSTTRRAHFDRTTGPKRILALDGGGARTLLTLGALESIEARLRARHSDESLCLGDYFDLIAGTSTGAVVAAALAAGQSISEILAWYRPLAARIFGRKWTPPLMRPRHDAKPLLTALDRVFEDISLHSDELRTGLLVVTKRLDQNNIWSVLNVDRDADAAPDLRLREVLRASAAAPYPLSSEIIQLDGAHDPSAKGVFINGGMSAHNNPALQALMTAVHAEHGLGWATGEDRLLMVSVGSGRSSRQHEVRDIHRSPSIIALHSTLHEAADQVETMMQWMSDSDTSRVIDANVGSLKGQYLAEGPLISYARYDVSLDADIVREDFGMDLTPEQLERMKPLDARHEALDDLLELGRQLGTKQVKADHFPTAFDLPPL
ncbi:MAG: patatin-like phospholipase family protein [Myxococcota bacterium]